MHLVQYYVKLLQELDVRKVLSYMKVRGHLSLLPSIVRVLEREPKKVAFSVTVAHEADLHKFARSINEAGKILGVSEKPTLSLDPKIVGGYIAHAGSRVMDKSFRNALVTLYRKTVTH